MEMKTYSLLKNELMNHRYGDGEYDVVRLFKIFSSEEIFDVEEIMPRYCDFIINLEQMRGCCPYMTDLEFQHFVDKANNELVSYASYIAHMVDTGRVGHGELIDEYYSQEKFVDRVNSITGNCRDFKILDVGAGQIPYSSFMLSETYDKVSAMDKFILSDECIRRFGVDAHDTLLKPTTNLGNYDFVVGNRPCEGIPDIVKVCVEQKKPYFLVLCACKAPGHSLVGWNDYLKKIDPQIGFSKDNCMAYNLDM